MHTISENTKDVYKFHEKFGIKQPKKRIIPKSEELFQFRYKFLKEELQEFIDSQHTDIDTSVDSLVDLVYVAVGTALMYGISAERLEETAEIMTHDSSPYWGSYSEFLDGQKPLAWLSEDDFNSFVLDMTDLIDKFKLMHEDGNVKGIQSVISLICMGVYGAAAKMGITRAVWEDLWDDVQRANMSKKRAESKEESKRGTKLDIVKPEGWKGPDTRSILIKHFGETQVEKMNRV